MLNKITFSYTASWSDPGRACYRSIYWYENNVRNSTAVSTTTHYSSPVNSSGTDFDGPRPEGTDDYYKIKVEVYDTADPGTVYASDAATDGEFDS
jgi:hypothetical protein